MNQSLGILETTGFTPAMVALDVMHKTAEVTVHHAELNDFLGVVIKILGSTDSVKAALAAGHAMAEQMGGKPISLVINRPDDEAWKAIQSPVEFNPLIQQNVVITPQTDVTEKGSDTVVRSTRRAVPATVSDPFSDVSTSKHKESAVSDAVPFALGFIETQGFTAVFEAIDSACKAANVDVVGKEKLGGGYVTVIVKGDVAAVKAAIDAGQAKVSGLGKLIAAHVIARPSQSVLSLLPKA